MEYMDFKKKDDRDVLQLERFPMERENFRCYIIRCWMPVAW